MRKPHKTSIPLVHFIGIGGIGMSSLAKWFLAQNWAVSGSDISESDITKDLKKDGVRVKIGQKRANVPKGALLIIYSQAVKADNPEFLAAKRRMITILSYPEMVGQLTRKYTTVAVAGAHGKSTTTALVALTLIKAGLDPTVIIGTKLKEFADKNFRDGKSNWLVLEADEYGRAFLNYSPTIAIVTNIDKEHLDTYKNFANVKKSFAMFLGNVKAGGAFILNRDNKPLYSLKPLIEKIAKTKHATILWYYLKCPEAKKIKKIIKIPGAHNISNALAVLKLARSFNISDSITFKAISGYRGSWRRMEYRGKFGGALVYDDYAHHPTEIKATLQAFREKYPRKKIVCVFQPHQAERLKNLFHEFQTAFDAAHETLILPIYQVAGRDKTNTKFNSEALVNVIQKKQPKKYVFYLEDSTNLKKALKTLSAHTPLSEKVIVMMGAGNIVEITDKLIRS